MRVGALVAVLVVLCALTGCTSVVEGEGVARQPDTGPTFTSSSSVPTQSSSPATTTPTTAPPTTTVHSADPPSECAGGTCPIAATVGVSDGVVILLRTGTAHDYPTSSVVEVTVNKVPVYWYAVDGDKPSRLACNSVTSGSNSTTTCIVVDLMGAHSSSATLFRYAQSQMHVGTRVETNTTTMTTADLNGDGTVDVLGLRNNETPDYAQGKVQWHTWTSAGLQLTPTGCTALAAAAPAPPPAPKTPATGACS